jgi:hypothetical protein
MKIENRMTLKNTVVTTLLFVLMGAFVAGNQHSTSQRMEEMDKRLNELTVVSRRYEASVKDCTNQHKEWECRAMLGGGAIFMVPSFVGKMELR